MNQTPSSTDTLFASIDGMAAPLGNQECVFLDRLAGQAHVMTNDVLTAMSLCRTFQPLAAHVATIEQRIPALRGQSAAIGKVLEFLRQRGLLHSADQVVERLRQSDRPSVGTERIAVRTCDRPSNLARLLDSLEAHQRRFGCQRPVLVFDDSKTADAITANAAAIAEAQRRGLEAIHLDRSWRGALVDRAAGDTGLPISALNQLLGGAAGSQDFSGGQVWNAALLATAGSGLFLLDDDFIVDFRQRSKARACLDFAQERERPLEFSPSLERLSDELSPVDSDLFATVANWNGAGLGRVLGQVDLDPATLSGQDWSTLQRLLNNAVVKSTALGTWGDAGMASNLWFYLMPKQWLQGWWADRETYFAQLRRPIISHSFNHFQATELNPMLPFSIDNSELVPPAAPLGRGEDLFFATSLRYLYPDSVALNLPMMVAHQRPDDEGDRDGSIRALTPSAVRLIGEYCLSRVDQCEAESAADRMRFMVATMRNLADAGGQRRQAVLAEYLAHLRADVIAQLQDALVDAPEAPAYFQADARSWIEANGKALSGQSSFGLQGWPETLSIGEAADRLGAELGTLADALKVWPELWQWAKQRDDLLTGSL